MTENKKRPNKKRTTGKRRRRSYRGLVDFLPHLIVLIVMIILVIAAMVMVKKWNKGQKSDYDPNAVTTEFDTEPTDYVLPLSAEDIANKESDDVLTILTLGNSPFADGYPDNNLAAALGKEYDATVINCGMEGSFITCKNKLYSHDAPEDGISLPYVAKAIATGDYSTVSDAASDISDQAVSAVDTLKNTDMMKVDCIMIMYNLEDYSDHRPLGSEDVSDITCIYGAVRTAIEDIRAAYPHIRVVYLSQPAGGVTIDDFFVDGDVHDIGQGLLSGYVTFELEAAASASASFVDIYYGAVNVDNRDKYLQNDYHLTDAGTRAIAARVHELITLDK